MLGRRLETRLPSIISEDQTDFILGCQLLSSVLLNVVLSPSASLTAEMVIFLDVEKAFDHVEWQYFFSVLHRFGFGMKFISWIRLLYSSPMASIKKNLNIFRLPFNTSSTFSGIIREGFKH